MACPDKATSPAGSTAFTNCTCNAGWTGPDAYLQFRLVPVVFRGNDPALCCYQVSEFRFFDMQASQITPTNATNPGGINPGGEEPGKMIDENITTKFLDFSKLPAEFHFSSHVILGSYEWVTGDNFPERDMLSWRMEGRQTATGAWTTLQSISNYPTTQKRKQIVARFNIPCAACVAGKYKASTGSAICTDCGVGTYSTAGGASASSTCSACPSNSSSPAGSAALTSCACNAGSSGPAGGPCTAGTV